MAKAPDAFRTISEVAEILDTPAHVLRFWESKFVQVKPVKRAGGRRYYRPDDVALLGGIKALLHDQGMTIKGAQKILRDRGAKAVVELGRVDTELNDDVDVIDGVTTPMPADSDTPAPNDPSDRTAPKPLTITSVSFIAAPTAHGAQIVDQGDPPAGSASGDNVVALSPVTSDPATTQPDVARSAPDLPAQPAPRPITGSRLLGTLARVDRTAVASRAATIRPLVDRLEQAHRRLMGR